MKVRTENHRLMRGLICFSRLEFWMLLCPQMMWSSLWYLAIRSLVFWKMLSVSVLNSRLISAFGNFWKTSSSSGKYLVWHLLDSMNWCSVKWMYTFSWMAGPLYMNSLQTILLSGQRGCKKCLFYSILKLVQFFLFLQKFINNHLKKRGHLIFYWVINSFEDYQKSIDYGAHGIMTDMPTLLKQFLI